MTWEPDQIKRVQDLYQAAMELAPGKRQEYLAKACPVEPALRDKVASLLSAHDEAAEMFDEPIWKSFVPSTPSAENESTEPRADAQLPFERLGAFRLVRRLGEGGMGVVYLAVQEPPRRFVALKILRPERVGSFEAEKRFWREIEAVSKLRHPNIVTVYGSGEEKNVRYFAMELVPGRDLDEILAESSTRGKRIATSKALAWTRDTARALAYAHQAGIIHRDVKPSNIRIDTDDRIKLMDFGVARNMKLSKMTLTGEFRGTPHYAAPEQVDAQAHAIDARTDVHALGVTLYEIVTGRVPFDGESTVQVFRQILGKDPTPPRRLNPTISRDLETVILTALEREPARRYQTMSDFADDIDRLLQGEMIHAKPGGAVTRFWKRVRRNPIVSASLGITFMALGALLLSIPWYVIQITREKNEAQTAATKAQMVNEFLATMFASPDPAEDGREVKVVDVLEEAIAGLRRDFADEPEIEAFLRRTIGRTYYRLGMYPEAKVQHEEALAIRTRVLGAEHPDTLISMNDLGLVLRKQGFLSEAKDLYNEALVIQRRALGEEHVDTLITLNNIANVLRSQRRTLEAESIYRKVLEVRRRVLGEEDPDTLTSQSNFSAVLIAKGQLAEAEKLQRWVFETRRRVLGDDHPDTMVSMNNLGFVLWRQDQLSEAESIYRDALEIHQRSLGKGHPETILVMENLVGLLRAKRELEAAEKVCRDMLEIQRRRKGDTHARTRIAIEMLAEVLREQKRFAEAEDLCIEALDLRCRILGDEHTETCLAMDALAQLYLKLGRLSEAEELYRAVLEIRDQEEKKEGIDSLRSMGRLGQVLMMRGNTEEVEILLGEALEIAERTRPPGDSITLSFHGQYGQYLVRSGRFETARIHLQAAYDGLKSSKGEEDPEVRAVLGLLTRTREALAEKAAEAE